MRIGIIGGTGREGAGLASRWIGAGHEVDVGSRDRTRAQARAAALSSATGAVVGSGDNLEVATRADVIVLCVPYPAHREVVESLRGCTTGRLVVDITVPLAPPRVREVHLPAGGSAAEETCAILGAGSRVVATLHHVSSDLLSDPTRAIDSDVLVCGDAPSDRDLVIGLIRDLGMRGVDAGPLRNAVALESLTPVLLHMNKRYGVRGAGIRITGLEPTDAG